jgi:hypothetical protein
VCIAMQRTYGPCQCLLDGGSTGGSSGLGGRGGTGGSAGRGGTGAPGGSAGVPPGGSAGTQGGIGGAGGGPPPPDGSAGTGGRGGAGGVTPVDGGGRGGTGPPVDAGSADGGPACLRCNEALMQGASPNDPRICTASRNFFTQAYNCLCEGAMCTGPCDLHCANPVAYPMTPTCQSCLVAACPGIAAACQSG